MFEIGLTEMMVIGVVALVVLGPEKLPKVARTLGHLIGRAQRYVNQVKSDINREMELAELNKLRQQVQDAAQEVHSSINAVGSTVENQGREIEKSFTTVDLPNPLSEPENMPPPFVPPPERIDPR
ncbi:MAG: hypothetical protein RLZZ502_1610 [Pseudomonadota bacterium]|jgi:sec-independent protein translocase protein TatB